MDGDLREVSVSGGSSCRIKLCLGLSRIGDGKGNAERTGQGRVEVGEVGRGRLDLGVWQLPLPTSRLSPYAYASESVRKALLKVRSDQPDPLQKSNQSLAPLPLGQLPEPAPAGLCPRR